MVPRVIDYMITGDCNLACPYCYGPSSGEDLTKDEVIVLFFFLKKQGVTDINISGGEPYKYQYLSEVINYGYKIGISVSLQTNATEYEKLLPDIPYLNWLSIPIDGVNEDTCFKMRTDRHHLEKSIKLIDLTQKFRKDGLRLKVGTVITQYNIGEMNDIAFYIDSIKPNIWKWYQVRSRGRGTKNYRDLYVEAEKINKVMYEVLDQFPDIPLTVSYIDDTVNGHLIINPDSEVVIPRRDDYVSYGNLVVDNVTINEDVWKKAIHGLNIEKYEQNIKKTFPGMID